MARKPVDEPHRSSAAPSRQDGALFRAPRHLDKSIDSFVHAPGDRGLVMIVFTLPSHDLVFKVIRDKFGAPKPRRAPMSSNATNSCSGRPRRPSGRCRRNSSGCGFLAAASAALAEELLREAGETCRIEAKT